MGSKKEQDITFLYKLLEEQQNQGKLQEAKILVDLTKEYLGEKKAVHAQTQSSFLGDISQNES